MTHILYRQVKVSDRLPEKDGIYVVYQEHNRESIPFICIFNNKELKWMSGDFNFDITITSWLEQVELPDENRIAEIFPIDTENWDHNDIHVKNMYGAKWLLRLILYK